MPRPRKPSQPITDFSQALDVTRDMIEVTEDARQTCTRRNPRIAYAARDLQEALSRWNEALKLDPRHPDLIAERLETDRSSVQTGQDRSYRTG